MNGFSTVLIMSLVVLFALHAGCHSHVTTRPVVAPVTVEQDGRVYTTNSTFNTEHYIWEDWQLR